MKQFAPCCWAFLLLPLHEPESLPLFQAGRWRQCRRHKDLDALSLSPWVAACSQGPAGDAVGVESFVAEGAPSIFPLTPPAFTTPTYTSSGSLRVPGFCHDLLHLGKSPAPAPACQGGPLLPDLSHPQAPESCRLHCPALLPSSP